MDNADQLSSRHTLRTGPAVISAQAVTKRYGGIQALRGIDLNIREGEIFGIIGPNGAGKSTLFDVLCGIIPPSTGAVQLFGRPIAGLASHQVARLGVARSFQRTAVFSDASVRDNLRFASYGFTRHSVLGRLLHSPAWRRDEEALRARSDEILELTGLRADADRQASVLAYGVQRRLAVGIALMNDPRLLFLDEPAAGMDDGDSADFVALIRKIAPGRTIVIVEHDMTVIRALCDFCLAMADGTPIIADTPSQVLRHPQVVEAYLGADDE